MVPSCAECNRLTGDGGEYNINADEEYVRNVICMAGPGDPERGHPTAIRLLQGKIRRSLENSPKLAEQFWGSAKIGPTKVNGIWIPNAMTFAADLNRFSRVIRKIVKGLFYHDLKTRLPNDHAIWVDPDYKHFDKSLEAIQKGLHTAKWTSDRVFGYAMRRAHIDSYATYWLMTFYERYVALAITHPVGVHPKEIDWEKGNTAGQTDQMNIHVVKDAADRFRYALERARAGGLLADVVTFEAFPRGSCGDACIMLGQYLKECGFGVFDYVWAEEGRQSHAWLQQGSLIVDITADQFGQPPVIVTTDPSWHARFEIRKRYPNELADDDPLRPAYQQIVKRIQKRGKVRV